MWNAYAFIMSLIAAVAAGIVVSAFSDEFYAMAGTFTFVFASVYLLDTGINRVVDAIKQNKCTCHRKGGSTAEQQPHAGYRRFDRLPDS